MDNPFNNSPPKLESLVLSVPEKSGFLENPFKVASDWASKKYVENGENSPKKGWFYIYVMSFWKSNTLPRDQKEDEEKYGLPKAIFTKVGTTACYGTLLTFEHGSFLLGSQTTNNKVDDVGFLANLAWGVGTTAIRAYYAFRYNKRSPGLSIYSLPIMVLNRAGKIIKKKYQEKSQTKTFK